MEKRGNKTYVLIVATLSSFLTPFMASSANIALPSIGRELSMNAVTMGWVATAYLISAAVFLLPLGRIADIWGRKRLFRLGTALYLLSSLLIAFCHTTLYLIVLRAWQGLGGAMIFSTGTAMLSSVYPVGQRGKALGINVAAVYLGLTTGPVLGGILTEHFGWRSIFLVSAFLCGLILYFTCFKLKGEWAEARGEMFDLPGSILYSIAFITLMYGFSLLPLKWGYGAIACGLMGMGAFLKWETKVSHPLFDLNLFTKNTVFALSNLAALINYSTTFSVTFILSLYLQYIKGFSPQAAGLIIACQPIIQTIFSPLAGALSDKIEPRISTSLGMSITTVSLFLFSFIGIESPLSYILISLMLLGFAVALFSSPNANAIMSSVEKKYYGVASGMMATMRMTGQMLSMGLAMLVFSLFLGKAPIMEENFPLFLKSIRFLFSFATVLSFFGIFASLARGKLRK